MTNVSDSKAETSAHLAEVKVGSASQLLPTKFLKLGDGQVIAYDDTPTPGPLIIAIPGMGDLRQEYRYVQHPLAEAGYRVVTMDIRGHGETSIAWPDYSAKAIAQDALALIDHLNVPAAILMGTSFAAGSALWAAALAPSRVSSVVMFGPILRDPPINRIQKFAMWLMFTGPWRRAGWLAYWNTLFPSRKPADHVSYRATLKQNLSVPGRFDALKTMVELSKRETEQMVRTVRIPCVALMGSSDPDYPDVDAEAAWIGSDLDAEVRIMPGLGHYPHVERPDLTLPLVLDFLRST